MIYPEQHSAMYNMTASKPVLTLGVSVLKRLHLYIAYKQKTLYATPAEAH